MAKQTINIGTAPNDGTGDTARDAFNICNDNFTELYEGAAVAEGTAILSTGEVGGTKFLREDGDGTSSWQPIPAPEGTSVLSTGPVTDGYVLTADGAGGAAWEAAAGGGGTPGGSSGDIQYNNGGSFAGSYLKQGTNTIEQRNSTNAQTYNVYGTYTDASNMERLSISHNGAGDGIINLNSAGTGTTANLEIHIDGTLYYYINNDGIAYQAITGGVLRAAGSSVTSPTFSPRRADTDTGIGSGSNDQLSIIAGGVEAVRITETSGAVGVAIQTAHTVAGLPATPAVGMIARVTDGDAALTHGQTVVNSGAGATPYLVWYNGTNWTILGS